MRTFLTRTSAPRCGVLIFDETGQAKKGTATAAVGRQYSGTMGRGENVIVAVYPTYASERGHALIDRDLYVQEDWFADPRRMARAGFPADHAFATKPQLALAQATRALAAWIHPAWAAGRRGVRAQQRAARILRAGGHRVRVRGARRPPAHHLRTGAHARGPGLGPGRAGSLEPPLVRGGGEGRRYYDWAWIVTDHPRRSLLIRRSLSNPGEIAYFYAYAPEGHVCSLTDLVKIAGTRWKVEDDFQDSKSTVGLDQTQVRLYRAWKRHVTMAMAALAFLAVLAAIERARIPLRSCPTCPTRHCQPTAASSR